MFGLQPWHLIVILAVALIIFGPQRLPEIGRAIGSSIREFRDAASTTQEEMRKGLEGKPAAAPEVKTEPPAKPEASKSDTPPQA